MLLDSNGEILSEVQENSYPLPYISRTCLVWEFLASELSLDRVQCVIIFDAPIFFLSAFGSTFSFPVN